MNETPSITAGSAITKERLEKEGVRYPGRLKLAMGQGGHHVGVLCKGFYGRDAETVAAYINDFASQDPALLLIREPVLTYGGEYVHALTFWGKTLTVEEQEWMNEFASMQHEFMENKRAARRKEQEEVEAKFQKELDAKNAAVLAEQKELEELAALGRHCRNNHKKGKGA